MSFRSTVVVVPAADGTCSAVIMVISSDALFIETVEVEDVVALTAFPGCEGMARFGTHGEDNGAMGVNV